MSTAYPSRAPEFTPGFFLWVLCCSSFLFFLFFCFILLCVFTFWIPCCPVRCDFAYKRCSVRLYLLLCVGGLISCLRHLCLFAYSEVQHILCTQCCQFFWIVHFELPLQYTLTFINLFASFTKYKYFQTVNNNSITKLNDK